jgi:hypothetical protein
MCPDFSVITRTIETSFKLTNFKTTCSRRWMSWKLLSFAWCEMMEVSDRNTTIEK